MRLLIDECLSPDLALMARDAGHEATHVTWIGLAGAADHVLTARALREDWSFVTRNGDDFRGRGRRRGTYAGAVIHAGLVCLSAGGPMVITEQTALFAAVLDRIAGGLEPIGQLIEASIGPDGSITVAARPFPP